MLEEKKKDLLSYSIYFLAGILLFIFLPFHALITETDFHCMDRSLLVHDEYLLKNISYPKVFIYILHCIETQYCKCNSHRFLLNK